MLRKISLIMALVLLGILSSAADARTIISQDFNDTEVFVPDSALTTAYTGTAASVGGGWSVSNNAGTPAMTVVSAASTPDGSPSGGQSIDLVRATAGGGNHFFGRNITSGDEGTSGIISTSFYMYYTSGDSFTFSVNNAGALYATYTDSLYIMAESYSYGGTTYAGKLAYKLNTYDSETETWSTGWLRLTNNTGLLVDTWYGLRIDVDLDNSTYNVYKDDMGGAGWTLLIGDAAFKPGDVHDVNAMVFAPASGHAYIDDVTMTAVPEPMTLGLICMGATAMLVNRKRK